MNTINFTASNAEFIENTNNQLFRKMKIKAFASGENVHTLPIDQEVLKDCAYSVYDKPIVWKYNKYLDDAMGHEIDEVPVGFVKESKENPVIFEQSEDGRIFLTITALIWTKYCGRLIEIFERDDCRKDVSIEINTMVKDVDYSDKSYVEKFCVMGITILGKMYNPAVKGCKATLLEFSQAKDKYLKTFSDDCIGIDNSRESSISGKWQNPRRKLFSPIIKDTHANALLKEAYFVGDYSSEIPEITKFEYPHHIIKDGKLVLHKEGLLFAFQQMKQQGLMNEQVKEHLLRHYKELGLSQENFSEFSMSVEDFNSYFNNINETESGCNINMADETKEVNESCEGVVENSTEEVQNSVEEEKDTVIENTTEDSKEEVQPEDSAENAEEVDNSECVPEKMEEESEEEFEKPAEDCPCGMSLEEAKVKMAELENKVAELEASVNTYMEQIEKMSDYEELKQYKCSTEEKMAREAEMSEMEKVMSEISEKGFSFSEEDKKALMDDFKNFSSIDAWKNYVKAQVLDRADNSGIVRMGLANSNNNVPNTGSIWDRI